LDDRRRDGGTNFTLRTKEHGKHLTLNERDDDDEERLTGIAINKLIFRDLRKNK